MRGRKPEITSQIKAGFPAAPVWLSESARVEWSRMSQLLASANALAEPDADVLAAYCETVVQYRDALKQIADEGLTISSPTGLKKHPAVTIASDARKDLIRLAGELGLTPIARQRLRVEPDQEDALGDFLAGGVNAATNGPKLAS